MMEMKHLILECFCDSDKTKVNRPCNSYDSNMGVHCLQCEKASYTKCPNELAYSNEDGIVWNIADFIGFGGEMDSENSLERQKLIATWQKICTSKIKEAYDEYMAIRNQSL